MLLLPTARLIAATQTSKKEEVRKEQGDKAAEGLPEDTIYKLDIPANRYVLQVLIELEAGAKTSYCRC